MSCRRQDQERNGPRGISRAAAPPRPGKGSLGPEGEAVVEGAVDEDNGNEALMPHIL
jgi:hypothetical protein